MSQGNLALHQAAAQPGLADEIARAPAKMPPWAGPVLLAAVLRFLLLGMKPPHFDEGVNGWFVDEMTRKGFYHYDPSNYHGPLHFYVLFLFQTLLGRHIWALRLPMAAISTATVYLVTRFERFLERRVCLLAAYAMAVSPGFVFYSRYAIHEAWLVFFMMLALWGAAGLWKEGDRRSLWAAGMGVTGMILTKETYVIHLGCFALAAGCVALLEPFSPSLAPPRAPSAWSRTDLYSVLLVSTGAIFFFYSGGLLDFPSLKGLYQTFGKWIETGKNGNGHEKSWPYWLQLMAIYEWPALLGLGCSVRWLLPGSNRLLRLLAIYGCGTLAAYSIIHYKTPWCITSILWPFVFLFGAFVEDLAELLRQDEELSVACTACVAMLLLASAADSVRLNFFHYVDNEEKYVYVQTLNDLYKLTDPLDRLAARNPENYQLVGNIMLSSYHPLPWVLGDFTHIGYYSDKAKPDKMDAAFLLVEDDRVEEVEKALKNRYFTTELQLRDGQDPSTLYLDAEKFRALYPGRKPEFTPEPEPVSTPAPKNAPGLKPLKPLKLLTPKAP